MIEFPQQAKIGKPILKKTLAAQCVAASVLKRVLRITWAYKLASETITLRATPGVDEIEVALLFHTMLRLGIAPTDTIEYKSIVGNKVACVGGVKLVAALDAQMQLTNAFIETIAKKMLMELSASTPQTPNMSQLYQRLETDRLQGLKMLRALDQAGLLALVSDKGMKLKDLGKPEKIYCDNTNLMSALVPRVDVGVARETFFYNQIRMGHEAVFTGVGDFVVDGKHVFEVGGKGKGFDQIKDLPNSFVVSDGIEVGFGNRIPLWLFGFLY